MLSREQRQHMDTVSYRNGMRNIVYISGIARHVTKRSGFIQQTSNENHMIPFVVDGNGTVPPWVEDKKVLKIVGRVTGIVVRPDENADPKTPIQRLCVVRVLHFELPSVLEMPPEEAWSHSVPKGAPASDVRPPNGSAGIPHSKTSNKVEIAGFVSGVMFRKAGVPNADGSQQNASLHVLIQQTKNPDEAIPVRIYGKLSGEYEKKIKMGSPVFIPWGELRIDVKPTGETAPDGLAIVSKVPYVRSIGLNVATRDQISSQPDWALQLAHEGMQTRKRPAAATAQPGADSTGRPPLKVIAATAAAPTGNFEDDVSEDVIASVMQAAGAAGEAQSARVG